MAIALFITSLLLLLLFHKDLNMYDEVKWEMADVAEDSSRDLASIGTANATISVCNYTQ